MKITMAVVCLLLLAAVGCDEDGGFISDTGRVTYGSIEGGFYEIISDKGAHYLPENLSPDFRKDSLHVQFVGVITDRPTSVQCGRTIFLYRIERIP